MGQPLTILMLPPGLGKDWRGGSDDAGATTAEQGAFRRGNQGLAHHHEMRPGLAIARGVFRTAFDFDFTAR